MKTTTPLSTLSINCLIPICARRPFLTDQLFYINHTRIAFGHKHPHSRLPSHRSWCLSASYPQIWCRDDDDDPPKLKSITLLWNSNCPTLLAPLPQNDAVMHVTDWCRCGFMGIPYMHILIRVLPITSHMSYVCDNYTYVEFACSLENSISIILCLCNFLFTNKKWRPNSCLKMMSCVLRLLYYWHIHIFVMGFPFWSAKPINVEWLLLVMVFFCHIREWFVF